jgi:hypothetical protein
MVRLATRYPWPLAVRIAVSMSSGLVSGLASNTSVATVVNGAEIAGAVGKQHGVTVLQGKRHDREVNALFAPRG